MGDSANVPRPPPRFGKTPSPRCATHRISRQTVFKDEGVLLGAAGATTATMEVSIWCDSSISALRPSFQLRT
jgi:hypothetical protein